MTASPFTLGYEACGREMPCAPVLDPRLAPLLSGVVGSNGDAYRAWVAGWSKRNLEAAKDQAYQEGR